jgi:Fe-S oxidoreductase
VAVEAVLLVEYEADSPLLAQRAAADLVARMQQQQPIPYTQVALEPEPIEQLWGLREAALPSLYGLRGGAQPIAFVEDVGVPPAELPRFIHRVQEVLQRNETTASFLVHATTGQVHIRPFLDLQNPEDASRLWPLAEGVYNLVLEMGGTISSQHGTGLARTPWVARQYGPLYPVLRDLKNIFDPHRLFNPGKIIGPDPSVPTWPLRSGVGGRGSGVGEETGENALLTIESGKSAFPSLAPRPAPLAPASHWDAKAMWAESVSCNGCGHCRTEAATHRMCPIFRATRAEEASPRAKANLMRHLLREEAEAPPLTADAVRELDDLCVNCKMCAQECPARVNIPRLMLEAKAANVAEHGLSRTDWVFARTEAFARLGSTFALFANAALTSRTARWLLEKLFGVSRRRRLPPFAATRFLRRAERAGWTRPPRTGRPRVAYFVDVYADHNDPSIAEAVVAVLHHNGIEVYVPPGQRGCGMAPLAYGDMESAREAVGQNVRVLGELARQGYTIVCAEPTAAVMLKHDALDLFDDPDAGLVAGRVVELTAFLWDLHAQGKLKTDFRPLPFAVGHHVPCHLKALGQPPRGPDLLALIPGLRVRTIDESCSGMAGTFGLMAGNYDLSLEAGRPMLEELARPRALFGSTECSTCRLQMEDGARKRTLHPAQYLALAYGLMPELLRRLQEPIRGELRLR